ncbi:MAG: para-nitrobenzyl esterase [Limisphaerales bacterium]|jgi:para-nitrobenzyl esterase
MYRILLAFCLLAITSQLSAQCGGRYFWDTFENIEITEDILYGNNVDYLGASQDLFVDFFEPTGDTETERPLVVLAHGGFFIAGDRKAADIYALCTDLAEKGYACASIQYRLGVGTLELDSLGFSKAVIRGVQDARAAVRYFRQEATTYKIDPDQIFIGGTSAGGVLAMHYAYLQDTTILDDWINDAIQELGGLEGNSGNPGFSSDIKAVVSFAGAIKNISWMADVDIPVASTHGTADGVVPYGYGWVGFPLTDFITVPITPMFGSEKIHEELDARGIDNDFLSFEGAGHVPHVDELGLDPVNYALTLDLITEFLHRQLDCYAPLGLSGVQPEFLDVRPNPASNYIKLDLPQGKMYLEVYNTAGQRVMGFADQGSQAYVFSRSGLKEGLYLLQISFEDGSRFTAKVSFQ